VSFILTLAQSGVATLNLKPFEPITQKLVRIRSGKNILVMNAMNGNDAMKATKSCW
jgi:hypothetical protein